MRDLPLPELFEIVLDNKHYFRDGICFWIKDIYFKDLISDKEYFKLSFYVTNNLPKRTFDEEMYCWPPCKIEPRIEWIEQQIVKLKNS